MESLSVYPSYIFLAWENGWRKWLSLFNKMLPIFLLDINNLKNKLMYKIYTRFPTIIPVSISCRAPEKEPCSTKGFLKIPTKSNNEWSESKRPPFICEQPLFLLSSMCVALLNNVTLIYGGILHGKDLLPLFFILSFFSPSHSSFSVYMTC